MSNEKHSNKIHRDGGFLPNGELILHNIYKLKKSYATVVNDCVEIVKKDPTFQEKFPEVVSKYVNGLNFQTTQLSDLIQEKRHDADGAKIKVLSHYFGYDSPQALLREKTFLYKLSDSEHNAKLFIADWLHSNRTVVREIGQDQDIHQIVKQHMLNDTLDQIDPRLRKCNLGSTSLRKVFMSLEKSGVFVRRSGRCLIVDEPISTMILHMHDRSWQLRRCIERAYDETFGSTLQRRDLARLLLVPLGHLNQARTAEAIIEADADCQVAITAGNSSLYQHVLIELPPFKAAMLFLFAERKNNPTSPYSEGYQFSTFNDWIDRFRKIHRAKWALLHQSLKDGTINKEDVVDLLNAMTENLINNLKAVEYSIAKPLGKAKENMRYEKLKPMDEP